MASNETTDTRRLLEHVRFWWEAEEENARQQSNRARLLATAVFGLTGAALFKFPAIGELEDDWKVIVGLVMILGGACLVMAAVHLFGVLGPRQRQRVQRASALESEGGSGPDKPSDEKGPVDESSVSLGEGRSLASSLMQIPPEVLETLNPEEDPLNFELLTVLQTATFDLSMRNAFQRARLTLGQRWLLGGLCLLLLGLALYTLSMMSAVEIQQTLLG